LGEGTGAGIGPGSGGGTGGGPYRPGSGIDPPSLLREVKPLYTDQARRQGVEGDVVLEIVVQRDGTVGDVKILRRLGAGLDQKAIDAVRQWRFAPARRLGAPIDVVVAVAAATLARLVWQDRRRSQARIAMLSALAAEPIAFAEASAAAAPVAAPPIRLMPRRTVSRTRGPRAPRRHAPAATLSAAEVEIFRD